MSVAALAIGTVGQFLTVAAVVAVAWLVWRGGGSAAVGVLETANRILEKRVHDLETQQKRDQATIAELRVKTDYAAVLAPIHAELRANDLRAQALMERMLTVLDLIAERLGPDGNGARD